MAAKTENDARKRGSKTARHAGAGAGVADPDALLREARRRLVRLEVEARRIGEALACYEASEGSAGDERPVVGSGGDSPGQAAAAAPTAVRIVAGPSADQPAKAESSQVPGQQARRVEATRGRRGRVRQRAPLPKRRAGRPAGRGQRARPRWPVWVKAPGRPRAWVASLVVHFALLFLLGLVTMATIEEQEPELVASILPELDAPPEELVEVELEPLELDEPLDDAAAQPPLDAPAESLRPIEFEPLELPAAVSAEPTPTGELLTAVPGTGTGDARGKGRGRAGRGQGEATNFFGAKSQARSVVFLVDNSNSMTGGRLETALLELGRSIGSMSAKQSFHVMFYSDTTYRMFHPDPVDVLVPATEQNKQKLVLWLRTVQMCRGGKLTGAFEEAASLGPEVVYLLSDGVMGESTLRSLTADRSWQFPVHTIGMTVTSGAAAQRLLAIAQANGGMFRPIGIAPLARQMSSRRPIPTNSVQSPVWGVNLPVGNAGR